MKIALLMPNNANWRGGARAEIYRKFLQENGHQVEVMFLRRAEFPANLDGYDLIFNHAMQAPPDKLRSFAISHPKATIVHVNHSAIGHLDQQETIKVASTKGPRRSSSKLKEQGEMTRKLCDILYAARDVGNIWYASVDYPHIAVAAGVQRAIQLPTPMPLLPARTWRSPAERPVVVIVGRDDPIKNRLNQYIAAAGLKDKIAIHFVTEKTELLLNTMKAMGVDLASRESPHKHIPTMSHENWLNYLATVPDVILQCSYAESFNNVVCEAMQMGIPVVASEAIRSSDPVFRADPNNPTAIQNAIESVLADYQQACDRAAEYGTNVAKSCQDKYLSAIEHIKEHGPVFYPRPLPKFHWSKKTGERCIAVVTGTDECRETFDLALPSIQRYADRTGAKIVELNYQPLKSYPIGNKWICTELVDSFKQVLYLDCDIWIQDKAPDLFANVPEAKFAAYDELEHINRHQAIQRISSLAESVGSDFPAITMALNGGVMLFDSASAELYEQPEVPVRKTHTLDQDLLTVRLTAEPARWEQLGERYNWIFFRRDFWEGIRDAWFIHLAGARPHAYRCELLRRFSAGNFEPLRPPCKKRCNPAWRDSIK